MADEPYFIFRKAFPMGNPCVKRVFQSFQSQALKAAAVPLLHFLAFERGTGSIGDAYTDIFARTMVAPVEHHYLVLLGASEELFA